MIKAPPIRKPEPAAAPCPAPPAPAPVRRPNPHLVHAILQRKEDERVHKPAVRAKENATGGTIFTWLQRKLSIGSGHDPLEREADRVADRIVGQREPSDPGRSPPVVQRQTVEPARAAADAPPSVERALAGPGRSLEEPVRRDMETHFGHDFSRVRIHQGANAEQSARDIGAQAYTVGRDIVFGAGRFAPESGPGRHLLAHELAHVVQQGGDRGPLRRAPNPQLSQKAKKLAKKLKGLIASAEWKEIRKLVYPRESAAGIKRAKERRAGKLADMSGLGSLKSLDQLAVKIRALQTKWARLAGADARVAEIDRITGEQLTAAQVPKFEIVVKRPMEFKGAFSPALWAFIVSEQLVSGASLGDKDAAELANTALHESRHAEQHFLGARHAAGKLGKDAATIAAEHHIPKTIADKAVALPIVSGTDKTTADLAAAMFEAQVTKGAENQRISDDDRITEMAADRAAAEKALSDLLAGESAATLAAATSAHDALKAQIAEVKRRYTLYRNIPYEADAHEVGDAAELAFKRSRK